MNISHSILWVGVAILVLLIINLLIYPRIKSGANYIVLYDLIRIIRKDSTDQDKINVCKRLNHLHGFSDIRKRLYNQHITIAELISDALMLSKRLKSITGNDELYDHLLSRLIKYYWGSQGWLKSIPNDTQNSYLYNAAEDKAFTVVRQQVRYNPKLVILLLFLTANRIDDLVI